MLSSPFRPSWPPLFLPPQQATLPVAFNTHVWYRPVATATTFANGQSVARVPFGMPWQVRTDIAVVFEMSRASSGKSLPPSLPSCPSPSSPQHTTVPSRRTAHE